MRKKMVQGDTLEESEKEKKALLYVLMSTYQ
jgi:hypothetical protein